MENTDFIWVACSHCLQEGSRCWVEGQVLLEKLFLPIPSEPQCPFSARADWWWLSALHRGASLEACSIHRCHCERTAPMAGHLAIWGGSLVLQVPWVAVWDTGGLCHVPAVTAWEASGLWTMGCPVWPGLGQLWVWCSYWTGGERSSLLRVPVAESRAWVCPQLLFIF